MQPCLVTKIRYDNPRGIVRQFCWQYSFTFRMERDTGLCRYRIHFHFGQAEVYTTERKTKYSQQKGVMINYICAIEYILVYNQPYFIILVTPS